MKRLVYSPKAYVFIKDRYGSIQDVSRYVTAGSVTRRINQVSSASITLRNPNMIFTDPANGAAFRPMDPITIYLKRLEGRSVRVFTGYLDSVPIKQLYPGPITLEASCTLKKLLFTYFDPALPYTQSFLSTYGWINKNGMVFHPASLATKLTDNMDTILKANKYSGAGLNDSSLGQLLWATLVHIGNWDDSQIWIENLPTDPNGGIVGRMANLYNQFETANKEAKKEFEDLMASIVGNGGYGGSSVGGAGSINLSGIDGTVAEEIYKVGTKMNVPPKLMLAAFETGLTESNMRNLNYGDGSSVGWRQETAQAYPGVDRMNVPQSAERYFNEGLAIMAGHTAGKAGTGMYSGSWTAGQLSQAIQGSAYPDRYDQKEADAKTLLAQTAKRVDGGATTNPAPADVTKPANYGGSTNTDTQMGYPLPKKVSVVGAYGENRGNHRHAGVDLGTPVGTNIYAATDGRATWGEDPSGYGWYITIVSPTGLVTRYAHMSDRLHNGDDVKKGELIGKSGGAAGAQGAGDSQGPHLHFEVRTNGGFGFDGTLDPTKYIDGGALPSGGDTATTPTTTTGGNGSGGDNILSTANAAAVSGVLQFPSLLESVEAVALQGEKSLMNDKPLMPFIQQMADASLRSFMSMPNGDFFGFYPDYFGEFGHHNPYWLIDDVEVLDGGITLSDESVVTHSYSVGDTTGTAFGTGSEMLNTMFSAGVVTIFNAFETNMTAGTNVEGKNVGLGQLMDRAEAIDFLKRYGARPFVNEQPMIRSPFFEMFSAYQAFMLSWSRQFLTPFTFTFMPELFPGGKVGFPDHGIQMYIDEVTHSWDYESGFFTQANLMAPAAMVDDQGNPINPDVPPEMVRAIADPVLKTSTNSQGKTNSIDIPSVVKGIQGAIP